MKSRDSASTPLAASSGKNSRRRQEIISLKKPKALSCSTSVSRKPVSSMRFAPMSVEIRKSHPAAKRDGPRLGEKRAMRVLGRKRRPAVEIEGDAEARHIGGWDQAADDALAFIGLQPVDLAGSARQMFPDGQEQAGDEMEVARPCGRNLAKLLEPCMRKFFLGRDLPMAAGELCFGNGIARQRPDQPQTFFNAAVIERET